MAVNVVVITDAINREFQESDFFPGVKQLSCAVHLTMRRGKHPMMGGTVAAGSAEVACVGRGGKGGMESELRGENLIGAAAGLPANHVERIAFYRDS